MKATRIRAIVVGIELENLNPAELTQRLQTFYSLTEKAYAAASFPVQTRRITLPSIEMTDPSSVYQIKSIVDTVCRLSDQINVRWICLPVTGNVSWSAEWVRLFTNIIERYRKIFLHFITAKEGNISSQFSTLAARTILSVSRLSNNGYDNFRVGAGANIKPNTPFFPFSYHEGKTGFSIAVELIGEIIRTVNQASNLSLDRMRDRLIDTIEPIVIEIDEIGIQLEKETGLEYKGQDISISPFPDNYKSVAALIEMLGPDHCGQLGTLFITSLLTDVLKTVINRTGIRHVGFNGVMFSLLEDRQLAQANNNRYLSLEKLMTYSTVCGCGIDMVPLPGDIFEEEISNLILDISALSSVLKKPLGVRVLPVPLKAKNELTDFNHDFLTNTRIMSLDGQTIAFPLTADSSIYYRRFETV